MKIFIVLSFISFFVLSCKKDDESQTPIADNNEPYLIEAPIFVVNNYGFSPDSTSGCGLIANVYDSAFEETIIMCFIENVPDGFILEDFKTYTGILKVYPKRWFSCTLHTFDPPANITISSCEILYMKLYQ